MFFGKQAQRCLVCINIFKMNPEDELTEFTKGIRERQEGIVAIIDM